MQPTAINKLKQNLEEITTEYSIILDRIEAIDPIAYCKTRNYIDGSVTYLSPYISRGVISTKQVFESIVAKGIHPLKVEKLVQELAWRDYWQQIWIDKKELINDDLKQPQENVFSSDFPVVVHEAKTGITAIDTSIEHLYEYGYVHNHARMYLASIVCNIGHFYWKQPAQWLYYHLKDGDWASNALSWQWIAGTNSNKRYFANQENINNFCGTNDSDTFLDVDYSAFPFKNRPEKLMPSQNLNFQTTFPKTPELKVDKSLPTILYNYYNLDPIWNRAIEANRILLLEPSIFSQYPVSRKNIDFAIELSKNINGIQVFVGEYNELRSKYNLTQFIFKEHPLNGHYEGEESPREWMFSVEGYYSSFFKFWKKCRKELIQKFP